MGCVGFWVGVETCRSYQQVALQEKAEDHWTKAKISFCFPQMLAKGNILTENAFLTKVFQLSK